MCVSLFRQRRPPFGFRDSEKSRWETLCWFFCGNIRKLKVFPSYFTNADFTCILYSFTRKFYDFLDFGHVLKYILVVLKICLKFPYIKFHLCRDFSAVTAVTNTLPEGAAIRLQSYQT